MNLDRMFPCIWFKLAGAATGGSEGSYVLRATSLSAASKLTPMLLLFPLVWAQDLWVGLLLLVLLTTLFLASMGLANTCGLLHGNIALNFGISLVWTSCTTLWDVFCH